MHVGFKAMVWMAAAAVTAIGCGGGGGEASGGTDGDGTDGSESGADAGEAGDGSSTAASGDGGADGGELPAGTNCCEAHAGPNCDEPAVAQCVCAADPGCCLFDWDGACVSQATTNCAATCMPDDTPPQTCDPMQFPLGSQEAILTGSWRTEFSQFGEGEVLFIPSPNTDGSVRWDIDIPCDDTWIIWVRYFDQGSDDAYFVTVDGNPQPAATFEGDCTSAGNGYAWRILNEVDPNAAGPCMYLQDPWTVDWEAGTHSIEFMFREVRAVARILITNDPDFVPN